MSYGDLAGEVRIYSTAPQSRDCTQSEYLLKLADAARWSERYGCRGILIDAGDNLCEPWILASVVLQNTTTLRPLVTIRPGSLPPFSAAKTIATYAFLYRRRFSVRMQADDDRQESSERLIEYTTVLKQFLECEGTVSFEGKYYSISDQVFAPPLPASLMPEILIGAEHDVACDLTATLVVTPQFETASPDASLAASPAGALATSPTGAPTASQRLSASGAGSGIHLGVLARETGGHALRAAQERFTGVENDAQSIRETCWQNLRENDRDCCPYLVGSYDRVAQVLRQLMNDGFRTFIVDTPPDEEELRHISIAFQDAMMEVETY